MDDDELDILAWTMLGEAGGEGTQGMADVGHVVLNRLNTGRYGSSLTDVALAPKQFSTWNSGAGGNDPKGKYPKDSREFQRARQLAAQVVAGEIPGPPGRPLDYHTPSVSPYWADSKSRNGSYTRNGHVMYPSVPVPPGELPEVASLQDTRRTPALPPVPVTSSPDMAMMRRQAAPSQLIRDSFAQLPRPGGNNAGDSLAMRPVQGGRQQAPMFDAAYDERVGAMRQTRQPIDSQGMATGSSRAPAPVPASPYDRVTARLNSLPPVSRLPAIPPPTGSAPATRSVQSVPVRGNVPSGGFAGQERYLPPVPSTPSVARGGSSVMDDYAYNTRTAGRLPSLPMPDTQSLYGAGATDFNPYGAPMPDPLNVMPQSPNNALPSSMQVAAGTGFRGASNIMPPMPIPRPGFMPQVGTALSVQPMPPMPIPRPGIGGPFRVAPIPAPRSQRPGLFRIGNFELPQLPTQARSVAGRTAMIDAPLQRAFNGGGRQNTAAVQSYRNEGMSASQAYAAANNAATERAIANSRDPEAARRLNSR